MPFQAWLIFEIYAFKVDVPMERTYYEGDMLLPTERVKDGEVWDTRRLTQEAHWFITRKSGKTELGAAVDFIEACFLGDVNGQVLICAPSAELSKISFKAVRNFAMQVDPTCSNRMGGKYFRLTKNELSWQPGHPMKGEIKTMAAGKTPKDGYYASVVQADEHGQPSYVNGHCDMQASVDTCWGSTGPRREKLLMHTTTAGRVKDGPYKSKIENDVEPSLLNEMQYPLGQPHRTPDDYWCAFLLQLDKWELTDDLTKLDDPELFKKVNRSIGTTVQPTYYRERLHEAATGTEDTKQEVLTKDFNMWQTGRIQKWITGDKIRPLQVQKRITDCHYQDGWRVFVGLDFSLGDDLYAMVTLGVNYTPSDTMRGRFFADAVAWVLEKTMKESPNRPLYEEWVRQGWLYVCPGEVFDSMLSINQLAALDDRQDIDIRFFGYDPAQSIQPINQLKAWLQTILQKKNPQATAADIASVIQQMVVPVSQTALTQNPRIAELESMILDKEPWIEFSMSPLWPFCFGNCAAEVSSSDLRRIVKGGPQPTHKIDFVHGLLDALYGFDLAEGRVSE
jgi:phage terminase large subunit-like protein